MKISWRNEAVMGLILAAMFITSAVVWPQVPERIAVHWNIRGEVDGYGDRFTGLLLLPFMTVGLYLLLLVIPSIDPGQRNYANFAKPYTIIRDAIIVFLAAMHFVLVAVALGHSIDVTEVVCLMAGALMILLGNLMGKIRPNWFVGARTPWTLSSKASWNKTNRLCGWFLMGMGPVIAAMGIVKTVGMFIAFLVYTGVGSIVLVAYSYVVYRNDPNRISPAGTSPDPDSPH